MSKHLAKAYFYGGPNDGKTIHLTAPPSHYDWPIKPGDRHPEGRQFNRYVPCPEWSAHFKRPIFIPQGFPGRPPKRELQAA